MMKKLRFLNIVFILILFTANPLTVLAQGPTPDDIADSLFSLNGFNASTTAFDYSDIDSVPDAAFNVQPSYVQLQIGSSYGSGTILSIKEDRILILTAAHVFRDYDPSDKNYAIFFNGIVAKAKLIYTDETYDMGIVSIATKDLQTFDLIHLESISIDSDAFSTFEKQNKKAVFALDSEVTVKPWENQHYDLYGNDTKIASSYTYGPVMNTNIMVTDFGYKMLYAKCSAHSGMSGAGVFDLKCNLVGILAGGSDKDEMVALRLPDVIKALSDFEAASSDELSGE